MEFMASTIKVTPQKEKIPEKVSETPPDRPELDLSDAAVKELIHTAKKRGEKKTAAGVTIGRAVVTMLRVTLAPLVLCNAVELAGAKLHVVALGNPEHDRLTLDE